MIETRDKFDLLCEKFGGTQLIPNADLYNYLIEIKKDLLNISQIQDIPSSKLGCEVRRRSIADIRWLAQYLLWDAMPASDGGTKPVSENIFLDPQYDAFAELFIKKDPSVPIHKLSRIKTRLLLWPRGGAKSSYDHVDTVQWVLAYPSIRILYLTAEASLSAGFIGEVKGFFTLREDEPTMMNLFWPEHCCLAKDMKKGNLFTTPEYKKKKTGRKEATLIASSVGKTKSGWHYEIIKADDAVSDKNSETETQCVSVSEKLDLAENLLIPGGDGYYVFFIGTRYHELDHYGKLIDKFQNNGELETKLEGRGWKLVHNKTFNVDILIGRAVQIKPEVADRLAREGKKVTYVEAGEDGCTLLLPDLISFSFFMSKFTKNEKVTEGQLNQNPQAVSNIEFTRAIMARATVPYTHLPRQGPCSQTWDFAFSQKKGRDYSTGSSVIWSEEDEILPDGKKTGNKKTVGYVRKIIRDRFNHLTLAQAVVQLAMQERPFVIGIEDAAGSKFLEHTIIAEAVKTQDPYVIDVCSRIDWFSPDNQVDAKRVRMRALYPWIVEGRFKFLNACMTPKEPTLELLYSEFEKCLVSHHHDDIPDVLSQQPRYAPRATQAIVENNVDMFSRVDQLGYNQLFSDEQSLSGNGMVLTINEQGQVEYWTPEPQITIDEFAPEPDVPQQTYYAGMPNILGTGVPG